MKEQRTTARIHLLRASSAPCIVILRRKPTKQFHVIKWNTQTGEVEHGSWFQGKLYPFRCDLSPDGQWMIYLAMGATGETWTGICKAPWLKTAVDWKNHGAWHGGGWWRDNKTLIINAGYATPEMEAAFDLRKEELPFRRDSRPHPFGEDEGVLYFRLERDGYIYQGTPAPKDWAHPSWTFHVPTSLDGWKWKFSSEHPKLWIYQNKYSDAGRTFRFDLIGFPDFLKGVDWVTWDSLGQLVIAREGRVELYRLSDLRGGTAHQILDLEALEIPSREARQQSAPKELPLPPLPPLPPKEPEPPFVPQAPFSIVAGPLADQNVQTLIVDTPSTSSSGSAIFELAGEYAKHERERIEVIAPGAFLFTPGYYLRQHTIVWMRPPVDWPTLLAELEEYGVRSVAIGTPVSTSDREFLKTWLMDHPDAML